MIERSLARATVLVAALGAAVPAQQPGLGGTVAAAASANGDCIPPAQRLIALQQVQAFRQQMALPEGPTAPPTFPIFPQGGNLWQDLFIGDFVDLDPTGGILSWNCSGHTRDGHAGADSEIRTFGEQVIGVPVFAAADGIVSAAQDGFPDMNTFPSGQAGNYVIVSHPGGRDSWYFHLKNGSVAPSVGQVVKAGEQIGLTASSGNSAGPHLHFEVRDSLAVVEPWAGACRPGPSLFTNQPSYQGSLFVGDFAVSRTIPSSSPYPFSPPRSSHVVTTDPQIYFWVLVHNVPANSDYLVRFKRPDGSLSFQSGPWNFGNPEWNYAWWWFQWSVWEMATIPGTWTLELELNGQIVVAAPIDVLPAFDPNHNRAPEPVSVSLEPPAPGAGDVLVCRVAGPAVVDDRDWDIVRYQYVWKVNGQIVRSLTSAGKADMLPHHAAQAGQVVTCDVTPSDGTLSGPTAAASVTIQRLAADHPTVSLSQGGVVTCTIDLGASYNAALYVTAGSLTGTSPGIPVVPGVVIPLVFDSWTNMMITYPNQPPYAGMIGVLDPQGIGRTFLTVPPGLPPGLAGTMAWHAALVVGTPWVATNAVALTAVP